MIKASRWGQRAHALGTVEFVSRKAEHVDILLFHIDVQMANGLDSIGEKPKATRKKKVNADDPDS